MATRVRSYSKINLGLAIGPVRADGFHGLTTLYQTLELHDRVTVKAKRLAAGETRISLTTNHPFVPRDGRNTAWKMVERCLERLGVAAAVEIDIEKRLPVQGGMGAGSANAAAALIGLERELGVALPGVERLKLAAEVGSDVPLFLIGGAVQGMGRGEMVVPMPDFPGTHCVVAVPEVGVSTPAAFKDWDARRAAEAVEPMSQRRDMGHPSLISGSTISGSTISGSTIPDSTISGLALVSQGDLGVAGVDLLTSSPKLDRLQELSLAYSSLSAKTGSLRTGSSVGDGRFGTSGIVRDRTPDNKQGLPEKARADTRDDLAENTLLALVRTGIGNDGLQNDFEEVVFPQYPSLRSIKRQLMGIDSGSPAVYAALSGSGSALFGLYRSEADAREAQQRVQSAAFDVGVRVFVTKTLPRAEYWNGMFAE